jgi:hypothetical protein
MARALVAILLQALPLINFVLGRRPEAQEIRR